MSNTFNLTEDSSFEEFADALDVLADSGASTRLTKFELKAIALKFHEAVELEDDFFGDEDAEIGGIVDAADAQGYVLANAVVDGSDVVIDGASDAGNGDEHDANA